MKILLIGEYSRLHNSLKEGLQELGHDVLLIGSSDGFKNLDVDINVGPKFFNSKFFKPISKFIYKISGINLIAIENAFIFNKNISKLFGFDIVQLYNESFVKTSPKLEIWLLKKILKSNKKVFLLSCGIDYVSIKYANDKKFRYSILTPLQENKALKDHYKFILKKLSQDNIKLHNFLFQSVNGVIASDLDYHIPHLGHNNYLGMIPNPINIKQIRFIPLNINDKIVIFHGINTSSYIRKGNIFFDKAIEIVKKKYANRVIIIKTEDLPYQQYIKFYDSCHILLDQVYAYDQGYNALEAMAKGKVVFTGAEKEWLSYYNLKEDTVAINALPNANLIAEKLEWLIQNPKKIIEISKNARAFIEKEHNYIKIAKKYLDIWNHE